MAQIRQIQEAENKRSEVVDEAITNGRRLSDFFRESPLAGTELDLERDKSPIRDNVTL